jgi:DNA-binding protein YbaB
MFNPFKALGDMNQMRKQAMEIQKALEGEIFDVNEGDVHLRINGNQIVQIVEIGGVENEQVKRAINSAIKQSQQAAAGKLQELTKDMPQ